MVQDEGSLIVVAGHRKAAWLAYLGLLAMRHRGTAGAGLAASDGVMVRGVAGAGPLDAVLRGRTLDRLSGSLSVGCLSGGLELPADGPDESIVEVEQPIVRTWAGGRLAVALAGRLTNSGALRQDLLARGHVLSGGTDAELVVSLIASQEGRTLVNRVVATLFELRGAFNLAVASEDQVVVARDPRGFRPLSIGLLDGAAIVATEDVALDELGCRDVRDVLPGEVLIMDKGHIASVRPFLPKRRAASLIDLVLLARDDAIVEGEGVADVRLALGRAAAEERPAPDSTLVVGLPEAPSVAAGFAEASRRPLRPALIQGPSVADRLPAPVGIDDHGVEAPLRAAGVRGASVVLVVPALTTGHRCREAVSALRAAGASRVHVRAASAPLRYADPYGVALPPPEKLIASLHDTPELLAQALGADSAASLSLGAMRSAVTSWEQGWCDAAWSSDLPEPAESGADQLPLF